MEPPKGFEATDRILPYEKLMDMGEDEVKKGYKYPESTDPERMVEMLFTSGTTGSSKCVMLCEKNVISVVNSACESVNFSADDSIVSVLPIHHTYELAIMLAGLNYGMNIAINDSLKRVLKNFAIFKPTGLVLVPLFVSTMNRKIWEEAKKGKKAFHLFFILKHFQKSRKEDAYCISVRKSCLISEIIAHSVRKSGACMCDGDPCNGRGKHKCLTFGIGKWVAA